MEKFKMALLAVACLFLAGLNLWNEFKDWFDKNYQKRGADKQGGKSPEQENDRDAASSIMGKSKFNLKEEELRRKQRQAEQERAGQIQAGADKEQNIPIHSMGLEKQRNPLSDYNGPVSSEEEILLDYGNDKADIVHAKGQSFTVDEFDVLAKTLQGKPVPADEREQVPGILQKIRGTNIYEQFIGQVKGAEDIATAILRKAGELEDNQSTTSTPVPGNLSNYIRT